MTTLNDRLKSAATYGVYRIRNQRGQSIGALNANFGPVLRPNQQETPVFYHFTGTGSTRYPAEMFNSKGDRLGHKSLLTDGDEARESYELVPECEAPEPLKRFYNQPEQTSPKCTEREVSALDLGSQQLEGNGFFYDMVMDS